MNQEVLEKPERRRSKEIFLLLGDFVWFWFWFYLFVLGIFFFTFVHLIAYFYLFPYVGVCGRDKRKTGGGTGRQTELGCMI